MEVDTNGADESSERAINSLHAGEMSHRFLPITFFKTNIRKSNNTSNSILLRNLIVLDESSPITNK